MRHMPNDTIIVSVGSQELVIAFGPPACPSTAMAATTS